MISPNDELRNIPGIDKILHLDKVKSLIEQNGQRIVVYSARIVVDELRKMALNGNKIPSLLKIVKRIEDCIIGLKVKSLKTVINATGIIIHTNLGRSPLGKEVINESIEQLYGYNNLEFDLNQGKRGSRNDHLTEILKFLTGAEDILVVNNNAAAIMLIIRCLARNNEVIISRGELIEIGGSFRMPEIMEASDCKMVEVGTTNKTHPKDFEAAINENTGALLKVHQSNYVIKGFTQEVSLEQLVRIGKENNVPVIYDMGSGLLKKISVQAFDNEPDVSETLKTGVDLVCFSGDKLLGGAQAGIIAGKKKYIEKLKKEPMTRALRVGKTTIAMLETSCKYYLNEEVLFKKNLTFKLATQAKNELLKKAEQLSEKLSKAGIKNEIVESKGQTGGGSLPGQEIDSYAICLNPKLSTNKENVAYAELMFSQLLDSTKPLLGILKQGKLYFDVLTLIDDELEEAANLIIKANSNIKQ